MTVSSTSATKERSTVKLERSSKRRHGSGGFSIEILLPGVASGDRHDSGLGTIGRLDDANITPGTLVSMHPHRDDEIITYLRSGRVMHKDTVGDVEWFSPTRLMLMGAGREFQHEELVDPQGEHLRALQIFLRPESAGLVPRVQFHEFSGPVSVGAWRRIVGPTPADPLVVRSRSWVEDGRFEPDDATPLPPAKLEGETRLLYVFAGQVTVDGITCSAGEAAILAASATTLSVVEKSDLVLLTTDETAPVFKGGMFSGNVL
jgi:redox-sensitive bicupin YhaK (pirin superfamily)